MIKIEESVIILANTLTNKVIITWNPDKSIPVSYSHLNSQTLIPDPSGPTAVNLRTLPGDTEIENSPLLFKEGWPGQLITILLYVFSPAGVVDSFRYLYLHHYENL